MSESNDVQVWKVGGTVRVTAEQLAELKAALADCGCKENGYCEAWGCGVVADLIAEVERLRADRDKLLGLLVEQREAPPGHFGPWYSPLSDTWHCYEEDAKKHLAGFLGLSEGE